MTPALRIVALFLCLVLTACISIPQEAKDRLAESPSCGTAEQDVAALEADRKSGGRRAFTLLPAIVPVSAVIGILRQIIRKPPGAYTDHWRVIFGSYNREVDSKVAEIGTACR